MKRRSENMQQIYRSKICSKFANLKLQSNAIEITLRYGCSLVNLLHIFRTPFPKNTSGGGCFCQLLQNDMAMLQAKCKNNLHLFSMHNIISHAHHMLLKKEHSYLPKKKTDKINGVAFIMPGSQSTQNLNPKCPALRG